MICAKIGPLHEPQPARALLLVEDLGAGDVRRHQVGRELDPLEIEIEDVGERLDQQRLGQARHAGDQAVAAGEQRDQDLLDDLVLPDDDLAQLGENPLAALRDLLAPACASTISGELASTRRLGPCTLRLVLRNV